MEQMRSRSGPQLASVATFVLMTLIGAVPNSTPTGLAATEKGLSSKEMASESHSPIGPHYTYPSAPLPDASGNYRTQVIVAGVAVSVTTNFLPSGFESEPSDSSIQGALAASDNPRQEFEIQAATYGKGLPLEGISDVQPGSTHRGRAAVGAACLASGAQ
jgi:hypothetical protein